MPRRCVAAGCNTKSGEGYSLHGFPREQDLHAKWVRTVKQLGRPLNAFNAILQAFRSRLLCNRSGGVP